MSLITDILLTDIYSLISNLGKDGGAISASVYDTAQVMRFYPPQQGIWSAVEWLLEQQKADGGWGDTSTPLARDVPTLASVVALYTYGNRKATLDAVQKGLAFLRRQVEQWNLQLSDALPVGIELLLPWLLDEAAAVGLELPKGSYATLIELGKQHHLLISQMRLSAGTPATHSWEAWGTDPASILIDGSGGVGHSPAATAAWLRATVGHTNLTDIREAAQIYLVQAAAATGEDIPGVVPTAWPITRFEQAFVLYILLIAGLLECPQLQNALRPQIISLAQALRPGGLGVSDFFIPDGDDTAAGVAVLLATGHQVELTTLSQFKDDNYFFAYFGELQHSLSLSARATHVLALFGSDVTRLQRFLIERQCLDGRWPADKWHSSWLYTTLHVVLALQNSGEKLAMKLTIEAILAYQHVDGGWGQEGKSTTAETAYGVLALRVLRDYGFYTQGISDALRKAYQWLLRNYRPFSVGEEKYWMAKELYRPFRIERAFELSAMLTLALEEHSQ
ncbi:MAG: hypothetical protein JOZ78_21560 [Chroococcidiopsidaceae cyanobacterium CP_BM_ER_R8_30]|nr:hypothetical protein [Chroococcidiopsidaceae cyanobacterium CP_BM_ER_R8_30]